MDGAQQLLERFDVLGTSVKSMADKVNDTIRAQNARLFDLEQKSVSGNGLAGGFPNPPSLGNALVESDQFKSYVANGGRGHCRIEHKIVSSASGSGGATARIDLRPDIVLQPQVRLTINDLLSHATTNTNLVQVPREASFVNNSAVVAELALKPTSDLTFELLNVQVRVVAHLMAASRQILDDSSQLQSTIDTKLRYGLGIEVERQLLLGSGTGENLTGLMTQATAYDTAANAAGDLAPDTIRRAISQVETVSQLPVDAIVVNSSDWSDMLGLKDADGRYLSGGPFGSTRPMLWGRPVVDTPTMPEGQFLVGAFKQAATLYERMAIEVLLSSEHENFFARNMIAIRAECRLALAVTKPWALCKASYPA